MPGARSRLGRSRRLLSRSLRPGHASGVERVHPLACRWPGSPWGTTSVAAARSAGEVGVSAPEHRRPHGGRAPSAAPAPSAGLRLSAIAPVRGCELARALSPARLLAGRDSASSATSPPTPGGHRRCSPSPATAASPATSSCAAPAAATASPPSRWPATAATARRDPVYVDLILWRGQAEAAAEHLVKGQAVAFSGRFEPRPYTTRDGRQGVAYRGPRRRARVRRQAPRRRAGARRAGRGRRGRGRRRRHPVLASKRGRPPARPRRLAE